MEHADYILERIGNLFLDSQTADMMFVVEGEYLPAHKIIVSTSCEYFRALLRRNMKESLQSEVVLNEIPLRGFKLFLSYVYTGRLNLNELDGETIMEVLGIAHLYGLERLESMLSEFLQENLSVENVCITYGKAHSLQLKELLQACLDFMSKDPDAITKEVGFYDLSQAAFVDVISRDTFCAEELEIFKAVEHWRTRNPTCEDLSNVLTAVRFPLISTNHLVTTVSDSGLVAEKLILDAIRTKECRPTEMNFRGFMDEEVNLVSSEYGAMRLEPKIRGNYETGLEHSDYDGEPIPPHPPDFCADSSTGLTFALSKPYFINHIDFKLGNPFEDGYYVEVSVDLEQWVRVIDHSGFFCGSSQELYFESRVVRYVRFVGSTRNGGEGWQLSALRVLHARRPCELSCGFHVPEGNVASAARGALVFSIVELNGRLTLYDAEKSEWISHEVGSGGTVILLPQPFVVDSMRSLLQSEGSRAYKYLIETSLDGKSWTQVADRTLEHCRSWQSIAFEARPLQFIRIKGTCSTVGKILSFAHFECPAEQPSVLEGPAQADGGGSGDGHGE